jgi:hypothetical protein
MYEYEVLIIDDNGVKLYHTVMNDYQYQAEIEAAQWANQGGVNIDSVTVIRTTDPQGLLNTGIAI